MIPVLVGNLANNNQWPPVHAVGAHLVGKIYFDFRQSLNIDELVQKILANLPVDNLKVNTKILTIEDVGKMLDELVLPQYKESFKENSVDSSILFDLTEELLENDLNVKNKIHRMKRINEMR